MSRLKNFSRNLATSYVQLGVNVVYSLASVPLILHWLPRSEFGLWALLVQLMSYITLVDLGINQAIARFLVDHKDQRGTGEYGALVKISALVSAAQGLIILAVVFLGSPLLADLMRIPPEYQATFISLMRWQGVIAAFSFCMNPLGIMLNAHQRMDILSRQSILGMGLNLGLLFSFLSHECGIYSFIYANAITAVIAPVHYFWHCRRLGFLPKTGERGKTSWQLFKEVFLYGKDVFLMNLGAQLITASQTIIIARTLGLAAAAAWSVGTKIFTLVRQVLFQPYNAAAAGLSEMVARKEHDRLRSRVQNLAALIASLGVYMGIVFVMCNSLFVRVWLGGKIDWPPQNDIFLGLWLLLTALQVPHCGLVFVTKQIGGLRYLFLAEGCCFILLSLLTVSHWKLLGILVNSVLCVVLFSYQFGLRHSRQYFQVSLWVLAVEWVRPSLKLALALVPSALILWFATIELPVVWRLAIHGIMTGLGGGLLFLRIGLPSDVLREIVTRLPRPAAWFGEWLLPCRIHNT